MTRRKKLKEWASGAWATVKEAFLWYDQEVAFAFALITALIALGLALGVLLI